MRITYSHLQAKVDIVNGKLGLPVPTPFSTPGAVTLESAYGGTGVFQYCNDAGGVRDLMGGYQTKREANYFLSGMIAALRITQ